MPEMLDVIECTDRFDTTFPIELTAGALRQNQLRRLKQDVDFPG